MDFWRPLQYTGLAREVLDDVEDGPFARCVAVGELGRGEIRDLVGEPAFGELQVRHDVLAFGVAHGGGGEQGSRESAAVVPMRVIKRLDAQGGPMHAGSC